MHLFRILGGILLVAAVSAEPAAAQHPLILQRLTSWNTAAPAPSAQTVQQQVMVAAVAAQKRHGGCLPTSAVIDSVAPATAAAFIFNGIVSGQLRNGWLATARHPNCGSEVVRYTIAQDSTGRFSTVRTNRGASLANESIIGNTFPLAAMLAQATLKRGGIECDKANAVLGVTRVIDQAPSLGGDVFGVRYTGDWTELWPVTMCSRTVDIPIQFTADGDGGAYSNLKGGEAKVLPAAAQ